jgi:hypothetical protein
MRLTQAAKQWQKGIGLVEVAIALVVIGILVGAVLQGKKLIEQAHLNAIITDVQNIRLKTQHFKEKYGFLPGDFPFASRDIDTSLPNGEGNGALTGNPFAIDSSSGRFWMHLNWANGNCNAASGATLIYGDGLPSCGLGGGYAITSAPIPEMSGNWIVLGTKASDSSGEGVLLTPEQAQYINKRLDNGSPLSGSVRSLNADHALEGKCIVGGRYNLTTSERVCVMYFSLDE